MSGAKAYKIIFEDEWLIVVDKPSGLLVIPTPKKETNTLTDLLNAYLDGKGEEKNAYPCHRIDRETSGLVIFAKGKSAQKLMMDEFKKHAISKKYIALVEGVMRKDAAVINEPILDKEKGLFEKAETRYKVIERKKGFTVVEVEPVTGRTNQIRIHFKKIGYPLLGETVYAFRKDFKIKFQRVALHATALQFRHPFSNDLIELNSNMPDDMLTLAGQ